MSGIKNKRRNREYKQEEAYGREHGGCGQTTVRPPPIMRYASIEHLPQAVATHLLAHAREIYRAAFNNAWDIWGHLISIKSAALQMHQLEKSTR
ncbi:hypothetical protein ACSBOB_27795 [Mesorhizobium sp. ASY16-5R]|uniref:hypothetical protein n=1 Tax=Mesorhizobium sp. ASY16-5R TaxID=3445772 RepID=UPI003F9F0EA6